MKRFFLNTYVLTCFSFLLLLSGCQKNTDVEALKPTSIQNAITVEEASAWFTKEVVRKEKEMLAQPYSILPQKSPRRIFARMAKLQNKLIWDKAEIFNRNGTSYIVVPIARNLKLRSNEYELERAFVFYKNKDGHMKMNVVEVMSEKGESLNGRSFELIAAAIYNQLTSKNETVPGVNATVFFYNEAYQSLNSYKMKNQTWASVHINMQISNGEGLINTQGINTEAEVCTRWYVVQFNYEDGVMVSWEILYSYQECPQGGGGSNTDPQTEDPNGGGNGGTGTGQCNMTLGEADDFLNSITIAPVSDGGSTSGAETPPDANGIIRKPVVVHRDGVNMSYGLGYSERFELFFNGVVFKNNPTDQWKWEAISFGSISSVSGSTPPCISSSASASVSGPIISTSMSHASYTGTAIIQVTVGCLGGARVGSYPFAVYNSYNANHY